VMGTRSDLSRRAHTASQLGALVCFAWIDWE
jgi:hypothetical protein